MFRPKYGALGLVALPSLLAYLTLGVVAPIVDVGAIWLVWNQVREQMHVSREMSLPLETTLQALIWKDGPTPLAYYSTFILVEWVQSLIAFIMDRERPWPLLWVPCQHLVLRWLLNYVLLATLITALKGFRAGWGKLERKGSVLGVRGMPHS
jgi:peptidoglycan-N-acetylglucosamine deacetylase